MLAGIVPEGLLLPARRQLLGCQYLNESFKLWWIEIHFDYSLEYIAVFSKIPRCKQVKHFEECWSNWVSSWNNTASSNPKMLTRAHFLKTLNM